MSRSSKSVLVSVIIPTYNRSQFLRLTIESVLAQTYPHIEVIVIDDGSPDDTPEVMAQYAGRITYVRQENQGAAAAARRGFQLSSGDYITFLDHDDLIMPTKIERQVEILASRPEVGLVHCRYYRIDQNGNLLDKTGVLPEGQVLKELVLGNFIWSGASLIRRECFDQEEFFDDLVWFSDWGLVLRIALTGYSFACVQEPLGAYRILLGAMSDNVAGEEEGLFEFLDKVFTHPNCSTEVTDIKTYAYGTIRSWLSFRYYATGHPNEGQRNLAEALILRPDLSEQPKSLLQLILGSALDPRTHDPLQFVADVFEHLPSSASTLHRYRSQLLSWVYTELALQAYQAGKIAQAKQRLVEAIASDAAIIEQPDDFVTLISGFALSRPDGDPLQFIDFVLHNLPPEAQRVKQFRSYLLSEVSIRCAFEDYFAGRQSAARRAITAIRYQPSWLKNRGVLAILLKSLPRLMTNEQQ